MSKKTQSPWKNFAECIGTAIASVAVLPLLVIDTVVLSIIE